MSPFFSACFPWSKARRVASSLGHPVNLFFSEEEAQATTEYILILAVLVSIAILLVRDLVRPVLERLSESIRVMIEERMFKSGPGMHRLPFKR